jgi:hypothetical protein
MLAIREYEEKGVKLNELYSDTLQGKWNHSLGGALRIIGFLYE